MNRGSYVIVHFSCDYVRKNWFSYIKISFFTQPFGTVKLFKNIFYEFGIYIGEKPNIEKGASNFLSLMSIWLPCELDRSRANKCGMGWCFFEKLAKIKMRKSKAIKLTEISIQTLTLHTNCQKQNSLYYRIAGFLAPLNTIYVCACIYTHLH